MRGETRPALVGLIAGIGGLVVWGALWWQQGKRDVRRHLASCCDREPHPAQLARWRGIEAVSAAALGAYAFAVGVDRWSDAAVSPPDLLARTELPDCTRSCVGTLAAAAALFGVGVAWQLRLVCRHEDDAVDYALQEPLSEYAAPAGWWQRLQGREASGNTRRTRSEQPASGGSNATRLLTRLVTGRREFTNTTWALPSPSRS